MSLQVWLPLNGNLNNQGLSDITITNNGATVSTNGKIGNCYSFNGSNNYLSINPIIQNGTQNLSFCCWVKLNSLPASNAFYCLFCSRINNSLGAGVGIWIRGDKTLVIDIGARWDVPAQNIDINKWYHFTIVSAANKRILYINGIQTAINTNINTNISNINTNNILIGAEMSGAAGTANGTYLNGFLNDVRIYDHCLSDKEIEEISKGLILHYKLDQNINVLNNCYNYPTFNTSSASGGWSHWGPSGHSGTYSQNTDKQFIYNKNNTYSHCVDNTASATGKYYLCYQSPAFDGGYRSLQCIVKEANGQPITESICVPGWNARNGGAPSNIWTRITSLGDGFYWCQVDGISQSGSDDLVSITVQPGYKIYISEAYLENNKEFCSDIFNQDNLTTIYDSSGYNNNGIITGSLSINTNSARYNNSIYTSSGDTNYITSPTIYLPGDQITMNFWFKSSNKTPGSDYHMPFEGTSNSNQSYEISIYKTGYLRGGLVVGGSRKVDNCTSTKLTDGNWHMCTMTYDGTTIKRYVDSIMEKSTAATGSLVTSTTFVLGHYGSNTSYCSKETYTSDIRLYTTALTEAQVKELYNTSASIDKEGNVYTREVIE